MIGSTVGSRIFGDADCDVDVDALKVLRYVAGLPGRPRAWLPGDRELDSSTVFL